MSALISYGIGYSANSTAATSVVISPPPVYAAGDLLVMGVIAGGTATTGGVVPSLPAGWTRVSASGATLATFTKTATGSESPYTVTVASTAASAGFVAAFPAATVVGSSFAGSGNDVTSWTGTFPGGVTGSVTVLMVCAAVNSGSNTGYQNFNFSSGWTTDVPAFGPALPANPDSVQPVAIGLAEVTGSTSNPVLTSTEGCNLYGGFLVLNVTGTPPDLYQVTATSQAPQAITGMALTVKALTGAAGVSQIVAGCATESFYASTVSGPPQAAITPNATGSVIYGALAENFDVSGGTTFTANGSTTFSQNVADLLNVAIYGTLRSTGTTTASTPVTLGGSAPDNAFTVAALAEILKAGTITEVATATIDAVYPGQYSTTTAAQTAVFLGTQPPPGSLLVAMVSANSFWEAGNANVTITDSGGLTWTELVSVQYPAYAGVFVTQVPSAFPALAGPVQAVIPKTFSKGRIASNRGVVFHVTTPGPLFRQAASPARTRIRLPLRGRITSSPGGPVRNPASGPVFHPAASPARIRPKLPLRGRVRSGPGAPVANPVPPPGPVARSFSTGRISWNMGSPGTQPSIGPVFRQKTSPVRVHPVLPPRGQVRFNPGGPVLNPPAPPPPPPAPGYLPSFNAVPGFMSPGMLFPGEPVNLGVRYAYAGNTPLWYLDYLDADTRATLYATPGGNYRILIANTRAGLTIPPDDGRWLTGTGPADGIPLHRKLFLRLREHIHRSRRRSGYRNGGG